LRFFADLITKIVTRNLRKLHEVRKLRNWGTSNWRIHRKFPGWSLV